MSNELLKKILKKEEIVRKKVKKESLENVKNFS